MPTFKQTVNFLVYFYHTIGIIVCLYSDTDFHQNLFLHNNFTCLYFPILILLSCYFYYLTCLGPGYVSCDESPFIQNSEHPWHCNICNITPPLRASHCKKCGRCILRRDHHCPWLGVCIGLENHFFYILYLFFESIVFFLFMKQTFPVTSKDSPFIEWIFTSFLCAIICSVGAFGFIQTILLLPFHIFLAILNKTTWESLKSSTISYLKDWTSIISPFSHGLLNNIYEFITMRWNHPNYQIPTGEKLEQWKHDNSFLVNDTYECC